MSKQNALYYLRYAGLFLCLALVLSSCQIPTPGITPEPSMHEMVSASDTPLEHLAEDVNIVDLDGFSLTVRGNEWALTEYQSLPVLYHAASDSYLVIDEQFNSLFSRGAFYYSSPEPAIGALRADSIAYCEFQFQAWYFMLAQDPGEFEEIADDVLCLRIPYVSYGSDTGCCYIVADNGNSKAYGFYTISLDGLIDSDLDLQVTDILSSINRPDQDPDQEIEMEQPDTESSLA